MQIKSVLLAAAVCALPGVASAATFVDNAESLTNFTQVADADTTSAIINYSTLGIPEAPGAIPGAAATTGIKLTANKGDATAAITGINLVLGSTPITFSGVHTLEYYVWMNVPTGVAASTEQFLGGVNRSNTTNAIYGNFRTSRGNGQWFLLTGDNGNTVDFRQLNNGTLGNSWGDADPNLAPKLNAAFTNNLGGANAEAANEWVKVDVVADPDALTTSVYLNNVLFSTGPMTNTSGFAWIGYEDSASSIGNSTDLAGIFDNIRVIEGNAVPEPGSLALLGLGGLAMLRRRRH